MPIQALVVRGPLISDKRHRITEGVTLGLWGFPGEMVETPPYPSKGGEAPSPNLAFSEGAFTLSLALRLYSAAVGVSCEHSGAADPARYLTSNRCTAVLLSRAPWITARLSAVTPHAGICAGVHSGARIG
jgi:hypothetical protein